jgi:hypothetical protein
MLGNFLEVIAYPCESLAEYRNKLLHYGESKPGKRRWRFPRQDHGFSLKPGSSADPSEGRCALALSPRFTSITFIECTVLAGVAIAMIVAINRSSVNSDGRTWLNMM